MPQHRFDHVNSIPAIGIRTMSQLLFDHVNSIPAIGISTLSVYACAYNHGYNTFTITDHKKTVAFVKLV